MPTSTDTANPNRTRLLYAVAIVVLGLYAFDYGYRQMYEEPVREDENRISALNKEIQKVKLEIAKAKKSTRMLPEFQSRALPYKLEQARSAYQAWLLDLGKQSKLAGLNVDSGEPLEVKAGGQVLYQSIPFTFRGRGDMRQLSQMLHDFYAAGHLHKIRTMSFNPLGSTDMIDFNISISTLAMPTADREATLSTQTSDRSASSAFGDYRVIARRNLFQRGGQGLGKNIKLSAITSNSHGELEAWIKDTRKNRTHRLKAGERIEIGSLTITVINIEKKNAIILIDGQRYQITSGQNLSEGKATFDDELSAELDP